MTDAAIFYERGAMHHLILYSRSYCHLCHDMEQAVLRWQAHFPFSLDVLDVDADPAAVLQFDELVPVLLGRHDNGPSQEICHYFLDEARLRAFLQDAAMGPE